MKKKVGLRTIVFVALISIPVLTQAQATDDAVIETIQTEVNVAKSKADKNTADIESMKGGLPDLERRVGLLETTGGPKGDKGDTGLQGPKGDPGADGADGLPGEQGPIGPQGIQGPQGVQGIQGIRGPQGLSGTSVDAGRKNVASFYTQFIANQYEELLITLDPGTGFVITDIFVRAFNDPNNSVDEPTRFAIQSGGQYLHYSGVDPFGRIAPGQGKQELFAFESGIVVPPGGDITIVPAFSNTRLYFNVMGYYYEATAFDVASFYLPVVDGLNEHIVTTLEAGTGFVITDIFVRVFNDPNVNTVDEPTRFYIKSDGLDLYYSGLNPFGRIPPGGGKQDSFKFKSGVVVPPGGDISIWTAHSNARYFFTIMGYYY